jgi:hypothetical protein
LQNVSIIIKNNCNQIENIGAMISQINQNVGNQIQNIGMQIYNYSVILYNIGMQIFNSSNQMQNFFNMNLNFKNQIQNNQIINNNIEDESILKRNLFDDNEFNINNKNEIKFNCVFYSKFFSFNKGINFISSPNFSLEKLFQIFLQKDMKLDGKTVSMEEYLKDRLINLYYKEPKLIKDNNVLQFLVFYQKREKIFIIEDYKKSVDSINFYNLNRIDIYVAPKGELLY